MTWIQNRTGSRAELEFLLAAVEDRAPEPRERAIEGLWRLAIGQSGRSVLRKKIVGALRAKLEDRNEMVRMKAVEAIGQVGERIDVPTLARMTKGQPWVVRAAALSSIAGIGRPSDLPYIMEGLFDRNPAVRRYAVVAAYDLVGRDALPELRMAASRDKSKLARTAFAFVFAACGDSEALEELKILAESPSPRIAEPAKSSLKELLTGEKDVYE